MSQSARLVADPVEEPLDFSRRWTGAELMDDPSCDEGLLLRTVIQFETINRLISRYQSVLARYVVRDMAADPSRTYHLIDVGAGGCDIAAWLLRRAQRDGGKLRITALDGDPRTVRFARDRYGALPGLSIACADVMDLERFGPADYVFSNHVLHHLPDVVIPPFLALMQRVAARRWIVSDLKRSPWSYLGFQVFGRFFRGSFAFEDGKRSIRRGFRPDDFLEYAAVAGLSGRITVEQMAPGRLVVTGSR